MDNRWACKDTTSDTFRGKPGPTPNDREFHGFKGARTKRLRHSEPNDESRRFRGASGGRPKSQQDVLPEQIRTGLSELKRPTGGLFLSGLSTGLGIAFVLVGPVVGVVEPRAFGELSRSLVDHEWFVIVGTDVLARRLMGLLSWFVAVAQGSSPGC